VSGPALWLVIAAMGAATYLLRLSLVVLLGHVALPDLARRALRFVPPAVLTAIVVPELLRPAGRSICQPATRG
jgi:branched-subunit amino acid transport protein